jgi:hypothetical protein
MLCRQGAGVVTALRDDAGLDGRSAGAGGAHMQKRI